MVLPYCVHKEERINISATDATYNKVKKRLKDVFRTIFGSNNSNNFMPTDHVWKNNIPTLLKLVEHLVKQNDSTIDIFFDEFKTQKFLKDIANAIELDQWHDFISTNNFNLKRIKHCGKLGLVDCINHKYTSTNNKDRLMNVLVKQTAQHIRSGDDIDVSNNDPAKSFSDAQYTIIDTMPSYLKKIVDTNLIELKTAAYYIDSAPCKGGTSPNNYNFNTYQLNTHTELFIVNCAFAFYQSFFISLDNFVFTIIGMGDDTTANDAYTKLESTQKTYNINIKYLNAEGKTEAEHNYKAIGGQAGHFTVKNVVRTLVCKDPQTKSPSYDEINKLIIWLNGLTGLTPNVKNNFIVSFLTLNKGFGDFVQMFMCLYLFYIEITIKEATVCVFLYNIILATCDSHLTYIALLCECPFIIGGCGESRKIYMDGKSRYLDKTFETVWNTYNKIKMYKRGSIPEETTTEPEFEWKNALECACDGKGKGKGKASNDTSLSSILTFESNNKSHLNLQLKKLHNNSMLIFEMVKNKEEEDYICITLGINPYQIIVFDDVGRRDIAVQFVFKIYIKSAQPNMDAYFVSVINAATIENYKKLYKYLSSNVDVIITSILYNNLLYNMFIGNKTPLENIKDSFARANKTVDVKLFKPFTLIDFQTLKETSLKPSVRRPIERFVAWAIASNRTAIATFGNAQNINILKFYDYVIKTAECLKVLFSYYVAIDEHISKLNKFPTSIDIVQIYIVEIVEIESVPLQKMLIEMFGKYKEIIINEMKAICKTYYESVNVAIFFYYLPDQVRELKNIMLELKKETSSKDLVQKTNAEKRLEACSLAIKCFENIIESHNKIKLNNEFLEKTGIVGDEDAINSLSHANSEEECKLEDEDVEGHGDNEAMEEDTDAVDSNEQKSMEAIEILEGRVADIFNNEERKRIKGEIDSHELAETLLQADEGSRANRSGKRRRNHDDQDEGDGASSSKKQKGGYTVSEEDTSLLSFNIPGGTQLSFSVINDEHYIQLSLGQHQSCTLRIALDFSLSELIYYIKEQSIYDEEYDDPLYIMVNSMYKLLEFTEFIIYKSPNIQPVTSVIITLSYIRIYIEQILNEYKTVSLTISSEDKTIAINSILNLNQLLLESKINQFFTQLIAFISERCGITAENFKSNNLKMNFQSNMETRECIIVGFINEQNQFEFPKDVNASNILIYCLGYEIIQNTFEKVTVGRSFIEENIRKMEGGKNNKAKRTIRYKKIQDVRENITDYVSKNAISRTISISKPSKQPEKSPKPSKQQPEKSPKPSKQQPEKSPKPSKQPEKSAKPSKQPEKSAKPSKQPEKSPKPSKQPEKLPKPSKQPEKSLKPSKQPEKLPKPSKQPEKTLKPSKQQPEKLPKPSKQPEKSLKPSKQPEKSLKPSKQQPEKSPKPSKQQPEKSPKPSKQPEKSPKPSKQPEKLPKPSKQPEQIKVTDNNNQNISKYKLRVEQFKNKKFSAYFEKKLKTYLNDKNINIYKIGIMKMRGILKNIYKLD